MGFDYEDETARWRGDWPLSAEASHRPGTWREMSSMVGDAEARDAVRQLMKRFEFTAAEGAAMAYVLAKRSSQEYARLLRSEEHTSELQSHSDLVCRLLLEKKKKH